jgi:hypothetical protein
MEFSTNIMELITTYDGTKEYRKNCRYIKGEFYIKHKQCFLIDGTWYRINSDRIVFDHETKTWVVRDGFGLLIEGIIQISNDGRPKFGWFSPNRNKNVPVYYEESIQTSINEQLLLDNSFVKEGINGVYYFINSIIIPKEFVIKLKPHRERFYSFPWNYGSEPLIREFSERFNDNFVGPDLISDASKYLDNFTFGVEFETEKGAIPEKYIMNSGLIACRDGSIAGFEYATIPLKGDSGIKCIKSSCELLHKYCSCSPLESLHIHVGGFKKTVRNISALYRLGILVQKEIYSLFPYHYVNTANFKRKGYCNPLYIVGKTATSGKDIFNSIFNYLSGGQATFSKFPTGTHPLDRSGQHKWEISPRYHWLNLIPLIWGSRGTVEFRCHTPTVNSQKVINWLYIVVAIMKYAHKHATILTTYPEDDLKIVTLSEILKEAYPKNISAILIDYIIQRQNHYLGRCDHIGEREIFGEEGSEIFKLIEFV